MTWNCKSKDDGITDLDIYGGAPVHAEGKVDGIEFHFRSIGSKWLIWFGSIKSPLLELGGESDNSASWMLATEARRIIGECCNTFRERRSRGLLAKQFKIHSPEPTNPALYAPILTRQ